MNKYKLASGDIDRQRLAFDIGLERSARKSTYTLAGGAPSKVYHDIAEFLLGLKDGQDYREALADERMDTFRNVVLTELKQLAKEHGIQRLAFIEPSSGRAIGILPTLMMARETVGLPVCIVRPRKRLRGEQIKGAPVMAEERILVVSDVATSGSTLLEAVECIRSQGGDVAHAYVIFDREEGATERLAENEVTLHGWTGRSDASDRKAVSTELLH
jgi:orotate phosphoribosyltransferase